MILLRGDLWRRPEFLKVWAAQAVSEFGSRFARDGLPLTAVLLLRAAPPAVGLLAACATAPRVVVGLLAGGAIDRSRRRRTMIVCDLARAAVLVTVPLAALAGALTLAQLCVVAALVGAGSVVFDIANQAYVPELVDAGHLAEGNTKLGATAAAADVGGPAATGLVVQLLGAPAAVGATSLSYLASAASLALVRDGEGAGRGARGRSGLRDFRTGLRAVWDHPVIRPVCLMDASATVFVSMFAALYPFIALRELHLTPAMFGATFAAGGVGALAGAAARPLVMARLGLGPTALAAAVLAGAASFVIPLTRAPPVTAAVVLALAQFVGDAFSTLTRVAVTTLRQVSFGQERLGRVGAVFQVTGGAAAMTGGLAGGLLGQALGARGAMLIAAAGLTASALWAVASPLRTLRDTPAPPAEEDEDGPEGA